jgi:hypothetical protein
MATAAQIQANRRNALRSTGPRSEEGKAISRFNALKTGIQAKSQVIPGEDPAELEQLASDYHLQFQPSTPVERFLVDTLADSEWQLRRYRKVEARLWEQSVKAENSDLGQAFGQGLQAFTRLHRRIEALERSYFRALQQLQRLQAESVPDLEIPELPPPATELASFGPIAADQFLPAEATTRETSPSSNGCASTS